MPEQFEASRHFLSDVRDRQRGLAAAHVDKGRPEGTRHVSGRLALGYAFATKDPPRVTLTNKFEKLKTTVFKYRGEDITVAPSKAIIAADATMSQGDNERRRAVNNYTKVRGGWKKDHSSPHLNGQMPEGGNVLYMDMHVDWKRFDDMIVRTTGGPCFWW